MHEPDEPGYEVVGDAADAWNSPGVGRGPIPVARRVRRRPDPRLTWTVRVLLVAMALAFTCVLTVAVTLDPYAEDGTPLTMATHRQLGLPECNFVTLTGKPCPACGMTTSFALLMHGDPVASARANWVGTGLALACLVLVPWAVVSAVRARYVAVGSFEKASTVGVVVLLVTMFARWAAVLLTG
jgi:hypothetical protein